MMTTKAWTLAAGLATTLLISGASAHHGWDWTQDEQTEMTGTITSIYIGPPHPRIEITTADGDEKLMKAVRATIDGRQYDFYPDLIRED